MRRTKGSFKYRWKRVFPRLNNRYKNLAINASVTVAWKASNNKIIWIIRSGRIVSHYANLFNRASHHVSHHPRLIITLNRPFQIYKKYYTTCRVQCIHILDCKLSKFEISPIKCQGDTWSVPINGYVLVFVTCNFDQEN